MDNTEVESSSIQVKSEYKSTKVFKSVEPFVDLGNLLVEDLEPFDADQYKSLGDEYLKSLTRDNVQYLFNKIWELPKERVEEAIVVKLPELLTRIPREKPIPNMRAATRWERYANLKGIRKTKKSRMIWSEETQTWQPRFGYKRAKDETKNWVVEIPRQSDPYKDYIGEKADKKKERVAKNELQRLKNIRNEQTKGEEYPGMPPELKSSEQLSRQVNRATSATASIGKFTEKFKDEKRPKNSGKKRQFLSNENRVGSEKDKQIEILTRMQSKASPLDVDKAVGKMVQDEQSSAGTSKYDSRRDKSLSRGAIRKKSRSRKSSQPTHVKRQTGKRNRKPTKK